MRQGVLWLMLLGIVGVALGAGSPTTRVLVGLALLAGTGPVWGGSYTRSFGRTTPPAASRVARPLAPAWPPVTVAVCDRLDGRTFEAVSRLLLVRLGWHAQPTPITGDFGADLLGCDPAGHTWAIQCKRHAAPVGVAAVQEVLAAQQFYATAGALLITTSRLTAAAQQLAARTHVSVWDRNRLARLFAQAQASVRPR